MSANQENNKRIAKNTLMLYFRMLFIMAVSLYTSRVVLNTLGVVDFGIYNVVGGIVVMFSILNNAMRLTTQRFLTYEIGCYELNSVQRVFSTSVFSHYAIAFGILLLSETVGLWFLYNKMIIPGERIDAAFWVFQFSVMAMFVSVVSVPYSALITAHEKMSAFAYISVLEVLLKLLIVYVLTQLPWDKLVVYATLLFVVQFVIRMVYQIYCRKKFKESKLIWIFDKSLFRKMTSFAGWSLIENLALILSTQGLNILLNTFYGPAVNAARGVAVQVQGAIRSFAQNFQSAMNPQIIKTYAQNDLDQHVKLIVASGKYCVLLLTLLSVPFLIETRMILNLWLGLVPDHTVWFVRLVLVITMFDCTANAPAISISASGKIKEYQMISGVLMLATVPVSYVLLLFFDVPELVFVAQLFVIVIAQIFRLRIAFKKLPITLWRYTYAVYIRCLPTVCLMVVCPYFCSKLMFPSVSRFIIVCFVSLIFGIVCIWCLALSKNEKFVITSFLKQKLKRRKPLW